MTLETLIAGSLAMFVAGMIRGYSGFGFAIAGVPLMSLAIVPELAVPMVMLLQVPSGMQTFRQDRPHIDFGAIRPLALGSLIGVAPGLLMLAALSPDAARLVIGITVVLTVILLYQGFRLPFLPGRAAMAAIGGISGLLNGLTAMPGPPVIALFFASPAPPPVIRATLTFYFLLCGIIGAGTALALGVIDLAGIAAALLLIPAVFLGVRAGERLFHGPLQQHYRSIGLALLLVIGIVAILRALPALL